MAYDHPTAFYSWNEDESAAIARVIRSRWFTHGREVEEFERELAAFHNRKHAIYVNSGSSANEIMIAALFHKKDAALFPGDRAVVPAISWATLYSACVLNGLDLAVNDCDETWNMPPTMPPKGTNLIVGCPVLGNPAYLDGWERLASDSGAYFVVDACESLGATIGGRHCASFGIMSSVSFFISHQVAGIEGGAVLVDDDELAHLCRLLRNHGNEGFVSKTEDFDKRYDFVRFGHNYRGTEIHAAISRCQLRKLLGFVDARAENYAHWRGLSEDLPIIQPRVSVSHSPFGCHFEVKDGETRSRLVMALRAESIDCRPPCGGSFLRHSYGAPWRETNKTPRADLIHQRGIFLGLAPYPIPHLIERAVAVMRLVL
jgi:CDP-6-deoxy-D-xylo-4-hexulose-3-dehydrase